MTDGVSWVLLDVGNVVISFDHSTVAARLQTESRPRVGHVVVEPTAQRAAIDRFIFATSVAGSPNEALDRGTRDLEWLREQVCRQFDVVIEAALFEDIWTSIFAADVNDAVVTWASAMRSAGIRVAACSNTNRVHWTFLRHRHSRFHDLMDAEPHFLSFEMGQGKGDPGFFERVIARTQQPAWRHLLLDDKPENITAARAAGLRAQLYDPLQPAASLHSATTLLHGAGPHGE